MYVCVLIVEESLVVDRTWVGCVLLSGGFGEYCTVQGTAYYDFSQQMCDIESSTCTDMKAQKLDEWSGVD